MIQRIQHIYFLLIAGIAFWLQFNTILSFPFDKEKTTFIEICSTKVMMTGTGAPAILHEYILPSILLYIIVLYNVFIIFLFNKRSLQTILGYINYPLIGALILLIMNTLSNQVSFDVFEIASLSTKSIINIFLVILMLPLNLMALNGIKKDEELIKSADRIR